VPTYDYRCRDCGHTIEIIHSILEDGPELCERCRGPMQRVLHPTGVIFRGSGFYITDSRSSKAKATAESGGGGKESGEGKGSGESRGSGEGKESSAKGGSTDGSGGGTSTPAADSGSGGKE
jgi:putative FmdB family regulatory protein